MNIRYNAILLVLLSCFLFSCEDDGYADYDAGETNTKELSGEWYVSVYSMSGEVQSAYFLLSTYNTAKNDNTIFVDDNENWFPLTPDDKELLHNVSYSLRTFVSLKHKRLSFIVCLQKLVKQEHTFLNGRHYDSSEIIGKHNPLFTYKASSDI